MSAVEPNLRFDGFEGQWTVHSFGDVAETIPSKPFQIPSSEYKNAGIYPVVDQGKGLIAGYSDRTEKVFRNTPVIVFGDHTTELKLVDFPFVVGADGTKIIRSSVTDIAFLYYSMLANPVESTGYNRHFSILKERLFSTPSLDEQKRIVAFLSTIDRKFAHLRQQEAALLHFKTGLMQKLFSHELRFQQDDGEDFPDWEEYSLDDMVLQGFISLGRGNVISKTDLQANPGDYPVFSSSSMGTGEMGRYGKWMFDEELITWSIDGGGRFFHRNMGKFSVTNVSGYMRVDTSKICYGFLHACLEQQRTTKTFDYQNKAHPSVIRELYSVSLPSLAEQRKIADALSAMDTKIAAVSKEIALMETFKKGLLQQMFV